MKSTFQVEGAFFLFIFKVISYANTLCGIYNVQIIVYRGCEFRLWYCRGRCPHRPVCYMVWFLAGRCGHRPLRIISIWLHSVGTGLPDCPQNQAKFWRAVEVTASPLPLCRLATFPLLGESRLPLRDISINIRREATPQLFTIHFSLFTRVSAKPQFISYNLKFLYIFLAFI